MSELRVLGKDGSGRDLLLCTFVEWSNLPPTELPRFETPFLCVLVADALNVSSFAITGLMLGLMRRGCRSVICWGPDCERVHDIWDEAFVSLHLNEPDTPLDGISTWHAKEPLDEALWFALVALEHGMEGCGAIIAICQRREDWPDVVSRAFEDPETFRETMLKREDFR